MNLSDDHRRKKTDHDRCDHNRQEYYSDHADQIEKDGKKPLEHRERQYSRDPGMRLCIEKRYLTCIQSTLRLCQQITAKAKPCIPEKCKYHHKREQCQPHKIG